MTHPRPGRHSMSTTDENIQIIVFFIRIYYPYLFFVCLFYFQGAKTGLKGNNFEQVDAAKSKETEIMNMLTETDFQHCFDHWKIHM